MAGKNILIAEDEQPLAKALEIKLKNVGFTTKVAFNGKEATEILNSENFDCLVLDLLMPDIDGFGVLENIKDKNLSMKVVVTSNLSQEEDKKKALELGADNYLVKSNTSLSQIVEEISKVLEN